MQQNGLPADPDYFVALGQEMRAMQAEVADILTTLVGYPVNPKSGDQVADLLFNVLKLAPTKYTKTGRASTGKKSLEHLRAHPLVDFVLLGREYGKIDDAFCENIVAHIEDRGERGGIPGPRCYCQIMPTRVKTGRPASKKPNLLAIPVRTELGRRVRKGFKAGKGRQYATYDLNQIEMRTMAHRSQDPGLLKAYREDRDVHTETAARIWGVALADVKKEWRAAAKSTSFGTIMGITERGLADQMRLYGHAGWTEDRCRELLDEWFKLYPGVKDYQLEKRAEARRTGEVRDMGGRRYLLPGVWAPISRVREEALRQSHALDIQGSAQYIEKRIMARVDQEVLPAMKAAGWWVEPLLQIHDELLFEGAEGCETDMNLLMEAVIETTVTMSVPVKGGAAWAISWGELEK